jgi:hypothetical protein
MRILLGVVGVLGLAAVGCASHPAPTEQVASSLAAVRGAEEVGARNVPEAALHLKLAEEQIEQAKRLMGDGENARAEDRAVRAYQDAELAIAIARENNSKQKLDGFANAHQSAGGEQPPGSMGAPNNNPAGQ